MSIRHMWVHLEVDTDYDDPLALASDMNVAGDNDEEIVIVAGGSTYHAGVAGVYLGVED